MIRFNFETLTITLLSLAYLSFGWMKIIGPISLPALILLFLFFYYVFLNFATTRNFKINKIYFSFFFLSIFYGILLLMVNNFEVPFSRIRDLSVVIIISFTFYNFIFFQKEKYTSTLLKIIIAYICLSSIIAFFQSLNSELAWNLRELLPSTNDRSVANQIEFKLRPSGLAYYSVQLSYQLTIGMIIIFLLKEIIGFKNSLRNILIFMISIGGIFGANLSFILSLLIFLISFNFINLKTKTFIRNFFFIFFIISFILFSPVSDRIIVADSSALTRITFLIIGFYILINYPLGTSYTEIGDIKIQALSSVELGSLPFREQFLDTNFHNTFLTLGVEIGWIGFLTYILVYFYFLWFFYKGFKANKSSRLGQIYLIGFSGNLAYLAQLTTHNAGPFHSDPYFWIVNAIIIGYIDHIKKIHMQDY